MIVQPKARVLSYCDFLGNNVSTFNLPAAHRQLTITVRALVEVEAVPEVPAAISLQTWAALDAIRANGDHWDWLNPSEVTTPTPLMTGRTPSRS